MSLAVLIPRNKNVSPCEAAPYLATMIFTATLKHEGKGVAAVAVAAAAGSARIGLLSLEQNRNNCIYTRWSVCSRGFVNTFSR